jgi:uroporphyrinogen-III decarboxylase
VRGALGGAAAERLGAVLVGPWTIAMLLRNPEIMCLDTIDDPEFVHELMRFSTEYAKQVGDAVLARKSA